MLVALDVGNSRLTVGWAAPGDAHPTIAARTTSAQGITADQMDALLAELMMLDRAPLGDVVDGMALASVVPTWSAAIRDVARRHAIPIVEATAETIPIPVRIDRPAEAGADRLVNAFAAGRLYGRPAIVIDFGTATTLDVVAADGAYVGGAIAAGLELGLDALAARTAQLPRIELTAPQRVIGTDTLSAMRSGAVVGHIGLANELLRRTRAELAAQSPAGAHIHVIATGGLANEPWVNEIEGVDVVDPTLTIRGLLLLWEAIGPDLGVRSTARAQA
jgi:type III pantothenate kinase